MNLGLRVVRHQKFSAQTTVMKSEIQSVKYVQLGKEMGGRTVSDRRHRKCQICRKADIYSSTISYVYCKIHCYYETVSKEDSKGYVRTR
jgi:hypothetical protein